MEKVAWYQACAANETEAWEKLNGFLTGVGRKTAVSLKLCGADVEDAVQQTLLEAYQEMGKCADKQGAWIPMTVQRLKWRLIDAYREKNVVQLNDEPLDDSPDTNTSDSAEKLLFLRQTLGMIFTVSQRLGDRCPAALDLYFRMKAGLRPDLLTMTHLAKRLGTTSNHASVIVHRCLEKLLANTIVAEAVGLL